MRALPSPVRAPEDNVRLEAEYDITRRALHMHNEEDHCVLALRYMCDVDNDEYAQFRGLVPPSGPIRRKA